MILHEYKLLFIHIPKNAGTSIEKALGNQHNRFKYGHNHDHRTLRQYTPFTLSPERFWPASNLYETLHHLNHRLKGRINPIAENEDWLTPKQFSEYTRFSIVRNPWSRVYSWYNNVIADENHRKAHGIAPDEEPSLKDFLLTYKDSWGLHTQLYWLKDFSGKPDIHFIGFQETLQQSFDEFSKIQNLSPAKLPHAYKGNAPSYLQAYDEQSKHIVAERYAEEIKLFNYTFEGRNSKEILLSPGTIQEKIKTVQFSH